MDGPAWRQRLRSLADEVPGLVPVAKGNGYGFGLARLAQEAQRLGVDTMAVGTPAEVPQVREHFDGDIVVLTPWQEDDPHAVELARDPRVVITVSRLTDLEVLANLGQEAGGAKPRVLVEVLTSMRRHGIPAEDLEGASMWTEFVDFRGWTIHLPIHPDPSDGVGEAGHLARLAQQALPGPVWMSHLPAADCVRLAEQLGQPVRLRLGTQLWLGRRSDLKVTATVLDVHPVRRGERAGYRQRPAPGDGWVVVVAGGTANGLGMEAPKPPTSIRQRAIAAATGGLEALGLALSPYTIDGAKRWFLEPPHMQSSLVFLPSKATPPVSGDQVPVEARLTTFTTDRVDLPEE